MARYSQNEARMMAQHLKEMTKTLDRVEQLLEDLLVIYPDLDNGNVGVVSFGPNGYSELIKPKGYGRFKTADIHIVAEDFRRFETKKQHKKRVDEAMSGIGL